MLQTLLGCEGQMHVFPKPLANKTFPTRKITRKGCGQWRADAGGGERATDPGIQYKGASKE